MEAEENKFSFDKLIELLQGIHKNSPEEIHLDSYLNMNLELTKAFSQMGKPLSLAFAGKEETNEDVNKV